MTEETGFDAITFAATLSEPPKSVSVPLRSHANATFYLLQGVPLERDAKGNPLWTCEQACRQEILEVKWFSAAEVRTLTARKALHRAVVPVLTALGYLRESPADGAALSCAVSPLTPAIEKSALQRLRAFRFDRPRVVSAMLQHPESDSFGDTAGAVRA